MMFLIVLSCLIINGLFASFEMAFVTISDDDITSIKVKRTFINKLRMLKQHPERTLSAIQVGITLVGALAAAVGGTAAVESLQPYLVQRFGWEDWLAETMAVICIILPLTYFSVVIGELLPKSIALRHPMKVLSILTPFIVLFDRLCSPVVRLLEKSTYFLLTKTRLMSPEAAKIRPRKVSIEKLDQYHQKYVLNLVKLKGTICSDLVVPWSRVIWLEFSEEDESIEEKIRLSRHTRLPVMDGDTLVGILHTKEYLALPHDGTWQNLIRPALISSPEEEVLITFNRMQKRKQHLSVLMGKDEKPLGILTMENIIESIMGDIYDEDDDNRVMKLLDRYQSEAPENSKSMQ